MDVLELPRPVINFLRTMSKEMHRYSMCWDIYGGSESVTLTLTWKINCDSTSDDTSDNYPETGSKIESKSPKSPKKPMKKTNQKQMQHSKLDSLKTCSRILPENNSTHQRNLSAESDYKKSCDDLNPFYYSKNDKSHQSRRIADTSNSPLYNTPSTSTNNCQQYQYQDPNINKKSIFTFNKRTQRGKSLESCDKREQYPIEENRINSMQKNQLNTIPISIMTNETSVDDPWIRRDSYENKANVNKSDTEKEKKLLNLIETITKTNETEQYSSRSYSNSITNTTGSYHKMNSGNPNLNSSSKYTGASYTPNNVLNKVTFDPNLEYI